MITEPVEIRRSNFLDSLPVIKKFAKKSESEANLMTLSGDIVAPSSPPSLSHSQFSQNMEGSFLGLGKDQKETVEILKASIRAEVEKRSKLSQKMEALESNLDTLNMK